MNTRHQLRALVHPVQRKKGGRTEEVLITLLFISHSALFGQIKQTPFHRRTQIGRRRRRPV